LLVLPDSTHRPKQYEEKVETNCIKMKQNVSVAEPPVEFLALPLRSRLAATIALEDMR
jgi:hypothetical protein